MSNLSHPFPYAREQMSFANDDTKFVRESHLAMKERKLAKAFRIQKMCIYIIYK